MTDFKTKADILLVCRRALLTLPLAPAPILLMAGLFRADITQQQAFCAVGLFLIGRVGAIVTEARRCDCHDGDWG
jgi:hypothetical protein